MHWTIVLILVLLKQISVTGQSGLGCPLGWELNGNSCYQFVFDDLRCYDDAAAACWTEGSALVSVNSVTEHNFITDFLNRHGQQSYSQWYTSGVISATAVKWNGDGTYSNNTLGDSIYWNSENSSPLNDRIIYRFSAALRRYGWEKTSGVEPFNYICEIPTNEVYRILQNNRDFEFGSSVNESRLIEIGPKFQSEMGNVVIVGSDLPMVIDCVANGNPQPELYWFARNARSGGNTDYQLITPATSNRYTLTNGRLTISIPNEADDAGLYKCKAESKKGSIISAPVRVSFGYLNQFSPNQQGFVEAMPSQGTVIQCYAPSAKPALTYSWYKDDVSNFVRPELNNYFFISANGHLYLSEAHQSDAGNYYCVVTLVALANEHLSTAQPPSRTSKAIELRVPGSPLDFGPIIHPDFVAVFPKPPLVGQEVRLECFAYGRMPLEYSWSRAGKPFPDGTHFMYDNRIMIIPKAKFEDSGNYTCKVVKMAGMINVVTKSIQLQLEAKPYFVFPLRDLHADVGSELTWRCEARAVPRATYTWYKNSQALVRIPGEIEVRENVLFFKRLDIARDEGMYQCEATNTHGATITSAQLRVLSIKPSFIKYPLPNTLMAAQGGNLTIHCYPEAAPQPEIAWLLNGQPIGFGDSRRQVLLDGTLHITDVVFSDQGTYTCKATNINGEDSSSAKVTVVDGIQFQSKPSEATVMVNRTIFLYCQASYDPDKYDLTYIWSFNGKEINTRNDPFYKDGRRQNINGLYIINSQYKHSGTYECIVRTALLSISATAYLHVLGPPTEPAGVFVEPGSGQNRSVTIMWTWNPDAANGFPVAFFQLETITEYSSTWEVHDIDIPEHETVVPGADMKRSYVATDLLPYNSYQFRIRAKNELGVSPPSRPSEIYRVPAAPPVVIPEIINTGGGSVGLLKMEWKPLSRAEEGGPIFGYKVYWRLADLKDRAFSEKEVGNVTEYYSTVGEDNYYLLYAVKIQAYNKAGYGPTSEEFYVYSAEGMPVIRPTNVKYIPINGTAVVCTWIPVPDTREAIKGRVRGYRADYFDAVDFEFGQRGSTFVYGQTDQALIIGLEPHHDYWLRVSVFNHAGISTQSEQYLVNMLDIPPQTYPQIVEIFPHGEHSVLVSCRGIPVLWHEAQLLGYRFFYWPVSDDFRSAQYVETDFSTEGVIHGLQTDVVYSLRASGYSRAGDGKKSEIMYFTILKGGAVSVVNFDPSTSEIRAAKGNSTCYSLHLTVLMFIIFQIIT